MRYCKTKIVAMPIPSSDDVAQIKAEKVMDEIGSIIDEENLKDTIDIIEKQINESDYTAMDIAAAFLKQALGQVNLDKKFFFPGGGGGVFNRAGYWGGGNDRDEEFDFNTPGAGRGCGVFFH